MKFKKLHLISGLLIAGLGIFLLSSYSAGITGMHTVGCGGTGCHGAQSTGTIISLTGIPGTGWVPSTTYPLTLTVTNTAKVAAGFNFIFSTGTLTAGTGMALSGLEMRHTSPKTMTAGTSSWTFNWTAPASAATALTVNIAANAVNLNTIADANDNWNTSVLTFNAAATATPPAASTAPATAVTATGATLNSTVIANNATATVTFEYGLTTAYGTTVNGTPNTVTGTTSANVNAAISGLAPNTVYHYRVKAVNSAGLANGTDLTFTTLTAPPTVTTLPATAITTTGATLNGIVNANNNIGSNIVFEYGTTTAYGSTVTGTPSIVTGSTATPVSAVISGLTPGTLYHYRVAAGYPILIGVGVPGADLTFTTAAPPTVNTLGASAINTTGATLNASINANSLSTAVTFEYGTTTTYGSTATGTPATVTGSATTFVNAPVTGLLPATLYHYRVTGTNSAGTTNGADLTFTTAAITAPTAATTAATAITNNGATLNGFVGWGGATTTVTFEYGTTVAYGSTMNATPGTVSSNTATAVSAALTGLLPSTLYHYRVVAVNNIGTTNGGDRTFTTAATPVGPDVITLATTGITSGSATLNGTVDANGNNATPTFRYGLTTAYGSTAVATPNPVTGTAATAVSAPVTGLAPATLYHYQLVAVNNIGTDTGADLTFTTDTLGIPVPTLITGTPTALGNNGATVNGTANANGTPASLTVEYGQSLIYGNTRTVTPGTIAGTTSTGITAALTGLLPNKVYHYRFKAVYVGGTAYSNDATFSTTNLLIGSLNEGGFSIYPNPARRLLMIHAPQDAVVVLSAVSVNGTTIALNAEKIAADQYAADIAGLAAGSYMLIIHSNGKVYTAPFVKQ